MRSPKTHSYVVTNCLLKKIFKRFTGRERRKKARKLFRHKNWLNDFLMILSTAQHQPTKPFYYAQRKFLIIWSRSIEMHFFPRLHELFNVSKMKRKSLWDIYWRSKSEIYGNYKPCSLHFMCFNEPLSNSSCFIFYANKSLHRIKNCCSFDKEFRMI